MPLSGFSHEPLLLYPVWQFWRGKPA